MNVGVSSEAKSDFPSSTAESSFSEMTGGFIIFGIGA